MMPNETRYTRRRSSRPTSYLFFSWVFCAGNEAQIMAPCTLRQLGIYYHLVFWWCVVCPRHSCSQSSFYFRGFFAVTWPWRCYIRVLNLGHTPRNLFSTYIHFYRTVFSPRGPPRAQKGTGWFNSHVLARWLRADVRACHGHWHSHSYSEPCNSYEKPRVWTTLGSRSGVWEVLLSRLLQWILRQSRALACQNLARRAGCSYYFSWPCPIGSAEVNRLENSNLRFLRSMTIAETRWQGRNGSGAGGVYILPYVCMSDWILCHICSSPHCGVLTILKSDFFLLTENVAWHEWLNF